jgi:hypothetical protein
MVYKKPCPPAGGWGFFYLGRYWVKGIRGKRFIGWIGCIVCVEYSPYLLPVCIETSGGNNLLQIYKVI